MIDRFEKFSSVIGEIQKQLVKISSEEMHKFGIRGAQAKYLILLKRYNRGLTVSGLSRLCDRNKAEVSRLISELEKKGLVKKVGEVNYRLKICLTEEGDKLAEKICELAKRATEIAGEGITDIERDSLYRALDLISSNLQKISENGISEL